MSERVCSKRTRPAAFVDAQPYLQHVNDISGKLAATGRYYGISEPMKAEIQLAHSLRTLICAASAG